MFIKQTSAELTWQITAALLDIATAPPAEHASNTKGGNDFWLPEDRSLLDLNSIFCNKRKTL
jgi:hypothetical protein